MGKFFFFTDPHLLDNQSSSEAFGPQGTSNNEDIFQCSSWHKSTSGIPKAYAVCESLVFAQEVGGKLNLVLMPLEQPQLNLPTIKYFIYRGITKNSLLNASDEIDQNQSNDLVASILSSQTKINQAAGTSDVANLQSLGLHHTSANPDPNEQRADADKVDSVFFKQGASVQLPKVKAGWHIGDFDATGFGFEVVFDTIYYPILMSHVRASNAELKVSELPASPTSFQEFEHWHDKNEILKHLDPCAFYGSFYMSSVHFYDSTGSSNRIKEEDVYNDLLTSFFNKNSIWLDVRNDKNRAYDYEKAYGHNVKLAYDATSSTAQADYYNSKWPLLKVENSFFPTSVTANQLVLRVQLNCGDNTLPLVHVEKGSMKKKFPKNLKNKRSFVSSSYTSGGYTDEIVLATPNYTSGTGTTVICNYIKLNYFRRKDPGATHGINSYTLLPGHASDFLFPVSELCDGLTVTSGTAIRMFGDRFLVNKPDATFLATLGVIEDAQSVLFIAQPDVYYERAKGLVFGIQKILSKVESAVSNTYDALRESLPDYVLESSILDFGGGNTKEIKQLKFAGDGNTRFNNGRENEDMLSLFFEKTELTQLLNDLAGNFNTKFTAFFQLASQNQQQDSSGKDYVQSTYNAVGVSNALPTAYSPGTSTVTIYSPPLPPPISTSTSCVTLTDSVLQEIKDIIGGAINSSSVTSLPGMGGDWPSSYKNYFEPPGQPHFFAEFLDTTHPNFGSPVAFHDPGNIPESTKAGLAYHVAMLHFRNRLFFNHIDIQSGTLGNGLRNVIKGLSYVGLTTDAQADALIKRCFVNSVERMTASGSIGPSFIEQNTSLNLRLVSLFHMLRVDGSGNPDLGLNVFAQNSAEYWNASLTQAQKESTYLVACSICQNVYNSVMSYLQQEIFDLANDLYECWGGRINALDIQAVATGEGGRTSGIFDDANTSASYGGSMYSITYSSSSGSVPPVLGAKTALALFLFKYDLRMPRVDGSSNWANRMSGGNDVNYASCPIYPSSQNVISANTFSGMPTTINLKVLGLDSNGGYLAILRNLSVYLFKIDADSSTNLIPISVYDPSAEIMPEVTGSLTPTTLDQPYPYKSSSTGGIRDEWAITTFEYDITTAPPSVKELFSGWPYGSIPPAAATPLSVDLVMTTGTSPTPITSTNALGHTIYSWTDGSEYNLNLSDFTFSGFSSSSDPFKVILKSDMQIILNDFLDPGSSINDLKGEELSAIITMVSDHNPNTTPFHFGDVDLFASDKFDEFAITFNLDQTRFLKQMIHRVIRFRNTSTLTFNEKLFGNGIGKYDSGPPNNETTPVSKNKSYTHTDEGTNGYPGGNRENPNYKYLRRSEIDIQYVGGALDNIEISVNSYTDSVRSKLNSKFDPADNATYNDKREIAPATNTFYSNNIVLSSLRSIATYKSFLNALITLAESMESAGEISASDLNMLKEFFVDGDPATSLVSRLDGSFSEIGVADVTPPIINPSGHQKLYYNDTSAGPVTYEWMKQKTED